MFIKGRTSARRSVIALAMLALLTVAPAAFARSHVGVGINIGGPGYSIGYSNGCRHCGGGWWGGYVAPAYYAPAYYAPAYYAPAYYDYYPSYGAVYYDRPYRGHVRYYDNDRYERHGHRDGYYDRDRDYGHRDRDYHH